MKVFKYAIACVAVLASVVIGASFLTSVAEIHALLPTLPRPNVNAVSVFELLVF
ncbi:MAG: hypothetical protein AAF850_11890 [Pseudomonadota bacterium]